MQRKLCCECVLCLAINFFIVKSYYAELVNSDNVNLLEGRSWVTPQMQSHKDYDNHNQNACDIHMKKGSKENPIRCYLFGSKCTHCNYHNNRRQSLSSSVPVRAPSQPSVCEEFRSHRFQSLVSHYTDTYIYVFPGDLVLSIKGKKQKQKMKVGISW